MPNFTAIKSFASKQTDNIREVLQKLSALKIENDDFGEVANSTIQELSDSFSKIVKTNNDINAELYKSCGDVPAHYSGDGDVTCSDAMRSMAYDVQDSDYELSEMQLWWWLCAFKYVWRWPWKNGLSDVEKAIDCLQHLRTLLREDINRYDP